MLPTVIEESCHFYPCIVKSYSNLKFVTKPKLPLNLNTYLKYYRRTSTLSLKQSPLVVLTKPKSFIEIPSDRNFAMVNVETESLPTNIEGFEKPTCGELKIEADEGKPRRDSETGDEGDLKKAGGRRKPRSKGLPRRNQRNDRSKSCFLLILSKLVV